MPVPAALVDAQNKPFMPPKEIPGYESDGEAGTAGSLDHAVAALMQLGESEPLRAAVDAVIAEFGGTNMEHHPVRTFVEELERALPSWLPEHADDQQWQILQQAWQQHNPWAMQALVTNHGHVAARLHAATTPGTAMPYRQYVAADAEQHPPTTAQATTSVFGEPLQLASFVATTRHAPPSATAQQQQLINRILGQQHEEQHVPRHEQPAAQSAKPHYHHQRKPPAPKRPRQHSPPPAPRVLPPRNNGGAAVQRPAAAHGAWRGASSGHKTSNNAYGTTVSAKALRSITKDLLDVLEYQPHRVADWYAVPCVCGEEAVEVRIGPDGACVAKHKGMFKTCNRVESEVIPAAKNWKKSFKVMENGQRVQFGIWWAKHMRGEAQEQSSSMDE